MDDDLGVGTLSALWQQTHGKHGQTAQGTQRYRCRNEACAPSTFLKEYVNQACIPGVKERIVEMALNGSGLRDTSRVLGVSPVTVIETLKKRTRIEVCQYKVLGNDGKAATNACGSDTL